MSIKINISKKELHDNSKINLQIFKSANHQITNSAIISLIIAVIFPSAAVATFNTAS